MTQVQIEDVYKKSEIESLFLSHERNDRNSFLDAPVGSYPPRKSFDIYAHNLKKEENYILKHRENGRAIVATCEDEVSIIDMFIDTDYQDKGIVKSFVTNLNVEIKDNFINIKNISLASLYSGIIAWYKMGFKFYNLLDEKIVKTAISNALGRKVSIKDVTKEEFESYNLDGVIRNVFEEMLNVEHRDDEAQPSSGNVPMYMEIKR